MSDLRAIERHAANLATIRKIVHSLRSLSAVQYRRATKGLSDLRRYGFEIRRTLAALPSSITDGVPARRRMVIAFGADTGLCGLLTQRVAARTASHVHDLGDEYAGLIAIGQRTADHLDRQGFRVDGLLRTPASVDGIDFTVEKIARLIETALVEKRADGVDVVFARHNGAGQYAPTVANVFPIDRDDVVTTTRRRHRASPILYEPVPQVVERILEEWAYIEIYRAALETLASEHGARLQTTDAASKSLDRKLRELVLEANHVRQEMITEEVLEGSSPHETPSAPDASSHP